jgi:hypothetical protein
MSVFHDLQRVEKVQAAAHFVTRAAEHNGPMIFAQTGIPVANWTAWAHGRLSRTPFASQKTKTPNHDA